MLSQNFQLWHYLSPNQRVLAGDGQFLWEDSKQHVNEEPTDYSYLVFPFAKLYEGFLKQLFRDLGIIDATDYNSNHYRIGKALSPHLVGRLKTHSAYGELVRRYGPNLAELLWRAWKEGRNLVFHYYPHNYRSLTRTQAGDAIKLLIKAMESAVEVSGVRPMGSY